MAIELDFSLEGACLRLDRQREARRQKTEQRRQVEHVTGFQTMVKGVMVHQHASTLCKAVLMIRRDLPWRCEGLTVPACCRAGNNTQLPTCRSAGSVPWRT